MPRRFLRLLAEPDRRPFQKGSGRLELARAIADPKNPLTARVLVNRAWLWHFGKGLVTTPSDFGLRSDPPSHPELLDYLAGEFIASGWSLKTLHRRIMLSSTYQQRSEPRPDGLRARPRKPPALAVQSPAARFRVDARLAPGRLRRARSGGRRPRRARSPSRRSPGGARSTASSTARTSTDSTAPSTSPCPTRPAPGGS